MKLKGYFSIIALIVVWLLPGIAISTPEKSFTAAELAFYKGADRQQVLEGGAKKEGTLTFYTTGILNQAVRSIVNAFNKRYPYIKVEIWRAGTNKYVPRVLEEYRAGKYNVDVMEITQTGAIVLREKEIIQPFYSPNLSFIEEYTIKKAPNGGVFSAGHYQSGISLGYNTKLLSKRQVPKTYEDLLDPKWKGKMVIPGSNSGVGWMGGILFYRGEDFLNQLVKQEFTVHMASARAVLDMVLNGEYGFTPAAADSHANKSKANGAPIDWVPLEPVQCHLSQIMLAKYTSHPHAAMLFIDFDLSKEAGEIYKASGYNSPRKDISSPRTYKKYFGPDTTEQFIRWKKLFDELFVKVK
ncbi:ABC transporter substrate-binding protein [Thermodesulfobacteriota bacterium]